MILNIRMLRQVSDIRRSVANWNESDLDALSARFQADAVMSLPLSEGKDNWISGVDAIRTQFKSLKEQHRNLDVIDVFSDRRFLAILLSDGRRLLNLTVEPDEETGLIRRMIVCVSLFDNTHNVLN